jgi:hypothetical protein
LAAVSGLTADDLAELGRVRSRPKRPAPQAQGGECPGPVDQPAVGVHDKHEERALLFVHAPVSPVMRRSVSGRRAKMIPNAFLFHPEPSHHFPGR